MRVHRPVYDCRKQRRTEVGNETNAVKPAVGIPLQSASSHSISGGKNVQRPAAGGSSGGRKRGLTPLKLGWKEAVYDM